MYNSENNKSKKAIIESHNKQYFCTSEHNKSYTLIGQIWRNKLLYSPTGEYNKTEIFKMAAIPVLWKFTDKEISEIKINSVWKNIKACVKILKQLFASGSVIIGEYSPLLRLGEYSPIITSIVNYSLNKAASNWF
jgi:hypothetical protein